MTLSGLWQNEYGSQMDLGLIGRNLVMGTYVSSTGSTGKYMVIGYQQDVDPTPEAGQAVALAIEWHSIVAGPSDPSWHWSSGLSGQISIEDGAESLVLAHAMVASSDFPGLATAGTYIDKLTYKRISDRPLQTPDHPELTASLNDPIEGSWESADGTALLIRVYAYTNAAFGWISGKMSIDGDVCGIAGFTDINAAKDGLSLQSVAVTALSGADGRAIALAGCLDLNTGQLRLTDLASGSTAPDATYVQTSVQQRVFVRVGGTEAFDGMAGDVVASVRETVAAFS